MFLSAHFKTAFANHGLTPKIDRIGNSYLRLACITAKSAFWIIPHAGYFVSKEKYFPRFELLLGRGCPFNCKSCIHFLPDYAKDAEFESAESVIFSMKKLLSAVSHIDELYISGGDAFLYPELASVLEFVASSKKIGKIIVISTGAVSPVPEVIALLSNRKIEIRVENYGKFSDKIGEFTALKLPNIKVTGYFDKWEDFGDGKCRNRSQSELESQYSACQKERYCMLGGKIYSCPRAAHGENVGFFTCRENEYVELNALTKKKDILCAIKNLRSATHLTACNHCDSCTPLFKTYGIDVRYKD